ncbi:MAG: hypothetical protein JWQ11_4360 [Rhizobacter sp.]|nr:hypothetical protein [Rhizobacter sp.]
MQALFTHIRARPLLYVALAVGAIAGFATPDRLHGTTRALIGWDVGVWLYLLTVWYTMADADHLRLRKIAAAHSESAMAVTFAVVLATAASVAAIVLELAGAKEGARHATTQIVFTLFTVSTSWLLMPTLFAMTYSTLYYGGGKAKGGGLKFPEDDEDLDNSTPGKLLAPQYSDFMYFSFTLAVAFQTSDVTVTTSALRRLVLIHSVLSFVFNTAIVALMVNIAAGLI